ncbi:DUF427 domain-containing protein [Streptomyces sp. NBC_00063]|uniref:DUF427 domain-containing protein n=1 Tax=Streptomyces sp. NBC_00063 TaxID=2975638 RepID=UPI003D755716
MSTSDSRPPESVWDYPRPPAVQEDDRRVTVECWGERVADTGRAVRVLETSHPPVFYIPAADVRTDLLRIDSRRTLCEWKGAAVYWDIVLDGRVRARAAWSYPQPHALYDILRERFAFYPSRVDSCTVAGEAVRAQEGDFYGGWITREVQGPFKGGPGTGCW